MSFSLCSLSRIYGERESTKCLNYLRVGWWPDGPRVNKQTPRQFPGESGEAWPRFAHLPPAAAFGAFVIPALWLAGALLPGLPLAGRPHDVADAPPTCRIPYTIQNKNKRGCYVNVHILYLNVYFFHNQFKLNNILKSVNESINQRNKNLARAALWLCVISLQLILLLHPPQQKGAVIYPRCDYSFMIW